MLVIAATLFNILKRGERAAGRKLTLNIEKASKRVWQTIEKKAECKTSMNALRPKIDTFPLEALERKACTAESRIVRINSKNIGVETIDLTKNAIRRIKRIRTPIINKNLF